MKPFPARRGLRDRDGAETDLDLGITSASPHFGDLLEEMQFHDGPDLRRRVISRERKGSTSRTVQVIPTSGRDHAQDPRCGRGIVVVIVEIAATVGDIEGLPFLGRYASSATTWGSRTPTLCTLRLVPHQTADEMKTKPTQHSVNRAQKDRYPARHSPCRTERALSQHKDKISLSATSKGRVIRRKDAEVIYEVPPSPSLTRGSTRR
jgi:CTP synthase